MKEAVYSGSRNLYEDMVTAAKSLVANSPVEKVTFLIEDEKFPYDIPDIIETVDVGNQGFFEKGCANWNSQYTYMSLLRTCYAKLFPEKDKILQLDVDTVVVNDIGYLWKISLDGKLAAACRERLGTWHPYGDALPYYNVGVVMFNLDYMRKTGIDDEAISYMKSNVLPYIDQDAWNYVGKGKIRSIPSRYNECPMCGYSEDPAIVHFAGVKDWQNSPKAPRREYLKYYREMSWECALEANEEHRDA